MKNFKQYLMFLFLLTIGISSMCIALKTGIYGNRDTKQEVRAAEREITVVSTNTAMTASPSALVKADCTHIFYDYEYKNPVKDEVVVYANGGVVKEGEQKNNYKTKVLYTDILASYSYTVNTKGIIKPAAGKVATGFTYVYEIEICNDRRIEVKKDGIEGVTDLSQKVVVEPTTFRNLQDSISGVDRSAYSWEKMGQASMRGFMSQYSSQLAEQNHTLSNQTDEDATS